MASREATSRCASSWKFGEIFGAFALTFASCVAAAASFCFTELTCSWKSARASASTGVSPSASTASERSCM